MTESTSTTAMWIAVLLLMPVWWALALLMLALLADVSAQWRPRVLRLFGRLAHAS
jgi:hypothetical protein